MERDFASIRKVFQGAQEAQWLHCGQSLGSLPQPLRKMLTTPWLLRFAARSAPCIVEHLNDKQPDVKSRFQAGNLI